MYKIDNDIVGNTTQTYINSGINNNLTLTHRVDVSPNGNAFIEFTYTNDEGQTVKRTEWDVRPLPPYESLSPKMQAIIDSIATENKISTDEARELFIGRKRKAQGKRLMAVAKLFVPESELLDKEFQSYLEYITFISQAIGDKCNGVKLRVKFVYNSSNFVDTPDYVLAKEPWIEREDETPEDKSEIRILEGRDKLHRSQVSGTRAPRVDNPLEDIVESPAENAPAEVSEDLPF